MDCYLNQGFAKLWFGLQIFCVCVGVFFFATNVIYSVIEYFFPDSAMSGLSPSLVLVYPWFRPNLVMV